MTGSPVQRDFITSRASFAVAAALADGSAVGFEGAGDCAPVPDAQDQPTPRQAVQGGDGVSEADGVSQGKEDDGGAERDSISVGGHEGEGGEGFEGVGAGSGRSR